MKKRAYRISAVAVALLFLIGAWLLYKGDFLSLNTDAQKAAAIVAYASDDPDDPSPHRVVLHPVVQFDETFRNDRIVVFTDSEIDGLFGRVQFRRGVLGGWQPLSAFYNTTPVMIQSSAIRNQTIRVVYAVDCPPEIASYKIQANLNNDETRMAAGTVTGPKFFHVYETDRDFFPAIALFDADGNHLNDAAYLASDPSIPSPSIGSAEINMVYWLCAILLGVGWLIVKYLWEGGALASSQTKKETVD